MIWYVRQLLKTVLLDQGNLDTILEVLKNFSEHVESVYQKETYYGDATLKKLLEHSKQIVLDFEEYKKLYVEGEEENDEDDEEEFDEEIYAKEANE
jgi:hydroxymethylpyrimidine pyrophosphatase-like HAD family hydrolase